MSFRISSRGSFRNTERFLTQLQKGNLFSELDKYGRIGVAALAAATPVDSGLTAYSWDYVINSGRDKTSISWINTNVNNGANVAILLQYGHGTGTGGYVAGYDYINPAIRPVFDQIADDIWAKIKRY